MKSTTPAARRDFSGKRCHARPHNKTSNNASQAKARHKMQIQTALGSYPARLIPYPGFRHQCWGSYDYLFPQPTLCTTQLMASWCRESLVIGKKTRAFYTSKNTNPPVQSKLRKTEMTNTRTNIEYHGCWWPGAVRRQGISSHGTIYSIYVNKPNLHIN